MTYLVGYAASLVAFGIIDAIWLSTMAGILYRPTLGAILLERLRWTPALIFYFGFPLGIVHFAVVPALATGQFWQAAGNGALFGLFAYATYDLTNHATLRVWTLKLTLADMAYGTVATGIAAAAAFLVLRQSGF